MTRREGEWWRNVEPEKRGSKDTPDVDVGIQEVPMPEKKPDQPDISIIDGTLENFNDIADGEADKKKPPTIH